MANYERNEEALNDHGKWSGRVCGERTTNVDCDFTAGIGSLRFVICSSLLEDNLTMTKGNIR